MLSLCQSALALNFNKFFMEVKDHADFLRNLNKWVYVNQRWQVPLMNLETSSFASVSEICFGGCFIE